MPEQTEVSALPAPLTAAQSPGLRWVAVIEAQLQRLVAPHSPVPQDLALLSEDSATCAETALTSRALRNTGRRLPLATDGDDQAVADPATLIAPSVVSFPSGRTRPERQDWDDFRGDES